MEIKFNSSSEDSVIYTFLFFVEEGYILKRAYSRKKYFLFGSIEYFVEMKLSALNYKELITEALDNENYLEVDRLTKEYNSLKQIEFNKK